MIGFEALAQVDQRSLEVVGKAIIKATPQEVNFRIPLKIIDSSYSGCSDALGETLSKLRADLLRKGIAEDKIHTSNYNIAENLVYEGGKRQQQGYKGSVVVMVSEKYSSEFIQKVLMSVEKLKLTYAINFSLNSQQKDELSKQAITKAVEDAKQKAIILAEASQVQLGDITLISYGKDNYRIEPLAMERMSMNQDEQKGSNELNLNPPLLSLNKSVTIVWQIE